MPNSRDPVTDDFEFVFLVMGAQADFSGSGPDF
jgi:hypothetical protein